MVAVDSLRARHGAGTKMTVPPGVAIDVICVSNTSLGNSGISDATGGGAGAPSAGGITGGLIDSIVRPVACPLFPVIVTVPELRALSVPSGEIEATLGSVLCHDTIASGMTSPAASLTNAANFIVCPVTSDGALATMTRDEATGLVLVPLMIPESNVELQAAITAPKAAIAIARGNGRIRTPPTEVRSAARLA